MASGFQADWKGICSKISSIWSKFESGFIESPTKHWDLIPVKKLYIRSCYRENLEKFKANREQLTADQTLKLAYIGTSGIGKSGFLQTLLVYLVHEAQEKGIVYSIRLSVFQSARQPPQAWLLRTDGHCSAYHQERVDYYLSDSVDISSADLSNVRIACILATSEKSSESKQFEKLPERILIPLPVWPYDELLQISHFSKAENEIRYAIFGGSARHFLGSGSDLPVSQTFDYVIETMNWFFEEERRANELSEEQWQRIRKYLVECLSSANNKERDHTSIAVKALMWHTDNCEEFFCASRFMAWLAQNILSQQESSLKEARQAIVAASAIGFCFEYLGHKERLRCAHRYAVKGKGHGKSGFIWKLPQLRLRKLRRAEDMANLEDGSCC